jgi:predicted component of type VI protein secretion system
MQSTFRLVMRSGPTVGKVYPLDKNELFLGRDLSNEIVINDPEISRRHARLFLQGNGFILEDLGSTNGTFVNGQRLMGPNVLRPGDVITFGERMSMVYESSDYDQDATVVSPASRPSFPSPEPAQVYQAPPAYAQPAPSYTPPQQPVEYQQQAYPPQGIQQPVQPVDNYAGQVPSAYAPEAPAPRRSMTIWIVIAVIILLACICLAAFLWFAPRGFWCMLPIDWGAGNCP